MSVALAIALSPGQEQQALQDAYEKKLLRGQKLMAAQRLIEARRLHGKTTLRHRSPRTISDKLSAQELVKTYETEVNRKKLLIRKAELANARLVFITQALRRLLQEDPFITLLQAEGLDSLPQPLANLIPVKG